jgi:surfeit locus 1 family protein
LFTAIVVTLAALFFVLFVALGSWQVQRRAWKLDLIARVEQRVHAPASPAPGLSEWPGVTPAADEYRHVTATGTLLDGSQTLVQAVTDLGAGYWVLTPLREVDGSVVLVNRGFVGADDRGRVRPGSGAAQPAASASTVTGLLRMTEPGGAFLRHNNPAANRWYSRDVQAIAAARGLSHVAPYFIDAEAPPHDGDTPEAAAATGASVAPTPGLTVIHFHNSHLVYAITWYTLALMTAIAIPLGVRKR